MQVQQSFFQRYWWVIAGAFIFIILVAAIAASNPQNTPTTLTVTTPVETVNLDLYSNKNHTSTLTYIDWGNVTQGTSKTFMGYAYTTSTLTLKTSASDWTPDDARDYLTLSVSTANGKILPEQTTQVNFTLTVAFDAPAETDFSFTITVIGEEVPERFLMLYGGWQIYIDEAAGNYIGVHADSRNILIRGTLAELKTAVDEASK